MRRLTWQAVASALLPLAIFACGGAGSGGVGNAGDSASPDAFTGDDVKTSPDHDGATPDGGEVSPEAEIDDDGGVLCSAAGPLCPNGGPCKTGADCTSTACEKAQCVPASCVDKQLDGTETDVDCGGKTCAGCGTGEKCKVADDCLSDVCKGDKCLAATDTDGVENGGETAIDCGGALLASGAKNPDSDGAPACPASETCKIGSDCQSDVCSSKPVLLDNLDGGKKSSGSTKGKLVCQPATEHDGVKNGAETDVDCGGSLLADGSKNPNGDGAPACAANLACAIGYDCLSFVCTAGVCQSPLATDTVQNDSETDVDCGGALLKNGKPNPASDGAPACADTLKCVLGTDCKNLVCATGPVGPGATKKGEPINCPAGSSCTCQPATDTDGVKNDSETDVDCGGGFLDDVGTVNPASDGAPVCSFVHPAGTCILGADCDSLVCNAGLTGPGHQDCSGGVDCKCQIPNNNDGVQNATETDVDCGGSTVSQNDDAPGCQTGQKCLVPLDCLNDNCPAGGGVCPAASPTDGIKNDSETDIDCGGGFLQDGTANPNSDGASPCKDTLQCKLDTDCLSAACSVVTFTCVPATSCKGVATPAAILDISVEADTVVGGEDAIGVPNANGTGQQAGIDTCGVGESTDPTSMQAHESCCKSLLIPNLGSCTTTANCTQGETCVSGTCQARMDKYEATTGRVRQFLEYVKATYGAYNVEAWVEAQLAGSTPAGVSMQQMMAFSGQTSVLGLFPIDDITGGGDIWQSAVAQLGATTLDEGYPSYAQGCFVGPGPTSTSPGAYGASTYFWSSSQLASVVGSPPRPFTQDYYDIKPQNCTPYWIAAAFCAWDGGRLPTQAESNIVYGSGSYPWGNTVPPHLWNGEQPGVLDQEAATAGLSITQYTVDWHNSDLGASSGLGDFYYYPSYAGNNPSTGPLAPDPIIDTLTYGLDLTPYIAAPGRFVPDLTTTRAADGSNEGWMDYGANMLEYLVSSNINANDGQFCDTVDPYYVFTGNGSCPPAPGGAPSCSRLKDGTSPQETDCGFVRGNVQAGSYWEGGSWEGHGIQAGGYNEPLQTQYGKAGFRCVRPPEPTP